MRRIIYKPYALGLFLFLIYSCNSPLKEEEKQLPISKTVEEALGTTNEPKLHGLPHLPDTLYFAGERIPLEREDVRDKLMKELVIQVNFHSRTLLMLRTLGKWEETIRKELVKNEMPEDFLYLAIAESELDNEIISHKGAAGMWQFMPKSGRELGLVVNSSIDQRRDPFLATEAASKYLKKSKEKFGSWVNAMASYNRGREGFRKALEGQEQKSYFDLFMNKETSRYVFRILAMKLVYGSPTEYGFNVPVNERMKVFSFKEDTLKAGKYNTIELAKEKNVTFSTLKEYNSWIRDTKSYKLTVVKNVILRLPKKKTFI